MEIVLDNIIFSLQKYGGISTYWYELLKRLLADDTFKSSYISRTNENVLSKLLELSEDRVISGPIKKLILDRFSNPRLSKFNEPFIFHSSYNRYSTNSNALNVTTVHDLIHHKFYGGLRSYLHNYQKENSIKNSKAIITVSNNTKNDLLQIFPWLDQDLIHVIYNGVSADYLILDSPTYTYNMSDEVLNKKYIICVSSREPYKNFPFVVDVLEKMPDFNLYIVGPTLKVSEISILNSKIPGRYRSFNSLSNAQLNELYNHAFGMIYPSSYEGFGIPILEAMRAGCPSVVLNTSSIPEVAGIASIMVDSLETSKFIDGFDLIFKGRAQLIEKGLIQSSKFSWDKCYLQTSNLYKSLHQ